MEAKTLFEDLLEHRPERLRTLRRVKQWRAQHGAPKEVYFTQEHRPGEAAQGHLTPSVVVDRLLSGTAITEALCPDYTRG